ncbi:MAG: hypothetical protein CME60_10225, partial [Halobacteriovoraceae bacterium]|nr:hypothetical protein [Halobacteriovoraceae bacterium]
MKSLFILSLLLISNMSFALSERVIKREVNEEIRNGRILGVSYVDELNFLGCNENLCELDFTYQ